MIRFNANLFRIATTCQSTEETRYYLRGVNVEPHAVKGVVLVTIDGYRMLCIHDESGFADESAIVALSPEALKACKPGRNERRDVRIYTNENKAAVCVVEAAIEEGNETLTFRDVAISHDCKIDGTFPDWRRVVPQQPMILQPDESFPHFNGVYLASMGTIAGELEKHFDRFNKHAGHALTATLATESLSPALVMFSKVPEAFGVLMPVRAAAHGETPRNRVPTWLNAKPEATAAEEALAMQAAE